MESNKTKLAVILAEANTYLKAGNTKITSVEEIMEMDINFAQWTSLENKLDNNTTYFLILLL
jgi:hypothetical protein